MERGTLPQQNTHTCSKQIYSKCLSFVLERRKYEHEEWLIVINNRQHHLSTLSRRYSFIEIYILHIYMCRAEAQLRAGWLCVSDAWMVYTSQCTQKHRLPQSNTHSIFFKTGTFSMSGFLEHPYIQLTMTMTTTTTTINNYSPMSTPFFSVPY